jgi:iron complex transport system ATP-binding protein
MILLENITIGYETSLLSTEVIELCQGKVYILIGENGAGKTTLFKSIIGQIKLLSGSIKLNGTSITSMSTKEIAENIAFVPANFPTVDYMRVKDFIALGRSPHTNFFGRLSGKDLAQIERIVTLLGILDLQDSFVTDLSDGQRQLVGIAKALAQNTETIILDEPLAFLDYSNRRSLLEKLEDLAESQNKCILFSSHDIEISNPDKHDFLLVNAKKGEIDHYSTSSRSEIIQICFPKD